MRDRTVPKSLDVQRTKAKMLPGVKDRTRRFPLRIRSDIGLPNRIRFSMRFSSHNSSTVVRSLMMETSLLLNSCPKRSEDGSRFSNQPATLAELRVEAVAVDDQLHRNSCLRACFSDAPCPHTGCERAALPQGPSLHRDRWLTFWCRGRPTRSDRRRRKRRVRRSSGKRDRCHRSGAFPECGEKG